MPTVNVNADLIEKIPKLHWATVLVLGVMTLGLFSAFCLVLQARWANKRADGSTGYLLALGNLVVTIISIISQVLSRFHAGSALVDYASTAQFGFYVAAVFVIRQTLTSRPIDLVLGPFMTFFFGPTYFQYRLMAFDQEYTDPGRLLKL